MPPCPIGRRRRIKPNGIVAGCQEPRNDGRAKKSAGSRYQYIGHGFTVTRSWRHAAAGYRHRRISARVELARYARQSLVSLSKPSAVYAIDRPAVRRWQRCRTVMLTWKGDAR